MPPSNLLVALPWPSARSNCEQLSNLWRAGRSICSALETGDTSLLVPHFHHKLHKPPRCKSVHWKISLWKMRRKAQRGEAQIYHPTRWSVVVSIFIFIFILFDVEQGAGEEGKHEQRNENNEETSADIADKVVDNGKYLFKFT